MKYLLIAVAVVATLAGCTSKGNVPARPASTTIPVRLQAIQSNIGNQPIQVSGLLTTQNNARLSFKIGGVVDEVLVQEGQQVRRGQLLATIKATEIAAQVQQVQLGLDKAQREYQRALNLYSDSVGTLEQMQNARTGVDQARQSLQQVKFNQQYAKIYAPADGFIAVKNASAGEVVTPGATVLSMNLVTGNSPWILQAGVSDRTWAGIAKGDRATVQFDAFPGAVFKAVVSNKALASSTANGSFVVELQVKFGKQQPAAGMFGSASVIPTKTSTAFAIPYEALLEANGKTGYVFVTNDKKSVRQVQVAIASINDNEVMIASGLEGYNYIVTSGSPYLTDQAAITAVQ